MSSRHALSIVGHDQSARQGIAPLALVTRASERSFSTMAPAPARFHPEPGFEGRGDLRSADTDELLFRKIANLADQALSEITIGPFRLLPAQFLLPGGDKSMSLGSRAAIG
jgi:hypothetical protein